MTLIIATHDPEWMAHLAPRRLHFEHGRLRGAPETAMEAAMHVDARAPHAPRGAAGGPESGVAPGDGPENPGGGR